MIEFEKRGVPTVSFTAQGFVRDAHRSAENFGLPQLPIAIMREPFTNHSLDSIRALVDESIEQVIDGLTRAPSFEAAKGGAREITVIDEEWLTFHGDDLLEALDRMNDRFLEYGWTDGFPLQPPTEQRVERMLAGTTRGPQEVVAILEPGFGMATVEKIAANAVMAGCRPEHLPVVIAAVECLADPRINLRQKVMSTGPHAPLLVVNGPIRKRIGLNSGVCALGPGAPSFANSVIGRALHLCIMNLGHVYAGVSDMDTVGSPTKYSMCVAENEEASPWSPYHAEQGYDSETSTVTVHFVYGLCELEEFVNHDPSRLVDVFSTAAMNVGQMPTGLWLTGRRADPRHGTEEKEHHFMLLCPEHAQIFGEAGWSKDDLRRAMHRKARMPFRTVMLTRDIKAITSAHPELGWLLDSPDTLVPVLEDPGCYDIAVVGGAAGRGMFFWGSGAPVTREIG